MLPPCNKILIYACVHYRLSCSIIIVITKLYLKLRNLPLWELFQFTMIERIYLRFKWNAKFGV